MTITDEKQALGCAKLRDALVRLTHHLSGFYLYTLPDGSIAEQNSDRLMLEAALTELMELRAANTWQPIETAPKDVEILLFDGFSMSVGSWDLMDWCGQNPCWFPLSGATHWKPLPKPPEQKEGV